MAMSLVILAIVLASFALGFCIADIRAEVLDRFRRRKPAGTASPPATARRAMTVLPARRQSTPAAPAAPTAARRAPTLRMAARTAIPAASA